MFSVLNSSNNCNTIINQNSNNSGSSSLNSDHHVANERARHEHLAVLDPTRVVRMMDIGEEDSDLRFDPKRVTLNVGGVRHGKCIDNF